MDYISAPGFHPPRANGCPEPVADKIYRFPVAYGISYIAPGHSATISCGAVFSLSAVDNGVFCQAAIGTAFVVNPGASNLAGVVAKGRAPAWSIGAERVVAPKGMLALTGTESLPPTEVSAGPVAGFYDGECDQWKVAVTLRPDLSVGLKQDVYRARLDLSPRTVEAAWLELQDDITREIIQMERDINEMLMRQSLEAAGP